MGPLFNLFLISTLLIYIVKSDRVVKNCNELNDAISRANYGTLSEPVAIQSNTTIDISPCNGLVAIYNNITIKTTGASPATITGKSRYRIFTIYNYVTGGLISISKINLIDGKVNGDYGACLYIGYGYWTVSLNEVNFTNCVALSGAAIYSYYNNLIITNSYFSSNVAKGSSYYMYGGAIYNYYPSYPLLISNTTFFNNSVIPTSASYYSYGGAIYSTSDVYVRSSTFNQNSVRGGIYAAYGGAISNEGYTLVINNSSFTSNKVSGQNKNGRGGATYSSYISATSSTFSRNNADYRGGAIYGIYSLTLDKSSFVENSVISGSSSAEGGAVYIDNYYGDVKIISSKFTLNLVSGLLVYGGAISTISQPTINSSTFNSNYAFSENLDPTKTSGIAVGGAIRSYGATVIFNSTFTNNSAFSEYSYTIGGAVYGDQTVTINGGSIFSNNKAYSNANYASGGAVYSGGSTVINDGSTFSSNNAISNVSYSSGGAVYSGSAVISDRSTFSSNNATSNVSYSSGGAVYSGGGAVISGGSTFSSNSATSNASYATGGAITAYSVTISDGTFSVNQVLTHSDGGYSGGGAIYSTYVLDFYSARFYKNSADAGPRSISYGGAVYCKIGYYWGSISNTINSSTFIGNFINGSELYGGACHINTPLFVYNSSFISNFVTSISIDNSLGYPGAAQGAAIYSTSSIVSHYNNFTSNYLIGEKYANGGAIFVQGASENFNCIFNKNYGIINELESPNQAIGGAIYSNGYTNLTKCAFISNSVETLATHSAGGAVGTLNSLFIDSSIFTNNSAISKCALSCKYSDSIIRFGGGATWSTYDLTVRSSTFTSNSHVEFGIFPTAVGGAIHHYQQYNYYYYYYNNNPITFDKSQFTNNQAWSDGGYSVGGAVYIDSFQAIQLSNSSFTGNNVAGSIVGSAAFMQLRSPLNVQQCNFSSNVAVGVSLASGGVMDVSSTSESIAFNRCNFMFNSVSTSSATSIARGGAIHFGYSSNSQYGSLQVSNSTFYMNNATSKGYSRGGSIHVNPYQSASFAYSSFDGSKVIGKTTSEGGAIYGGLRSYLNFCKGVIFSTNATNTKRITTEAKNDIDTKSSVVRFCPKITLKYDISSSFLPQLSCNACGCNGPFNPCDPIATCEQINGYSTCTCPESSSGSGYVCGAPDENLGCA